MWIQHDKQLSHSNCRFLFFLGCLKIWYPYIQSFETSFAYKSIAMNRESIYLFLPHVQIRVVLVQQETLPIYPDSKMANAFLLIPIIRFLGTRDPWLQMGHLTRTRWVRSAAVDASTLRVAPRNSPGSANVERRQASHSINYPLVNKTNIAIENDNLYHL